MATHRLTEISAQKDGMAPGQILSPGMLKIGVAAASVAGCVFLASPAHQAIAAPGPFLPHGIQGNPLPLPVGAQFHSKPALVDIDVDGDIDIFVGDKEGTIHYFENIGTASAPAFEMRTGSDSPFWYYESGCDTYYPYSVEMGAAPAFADLDGDGDLDALVGSQYGYDIEYFENTGSSPSAPEFSPYTGTESFGNPFGVLGNGYGTSPAFADIDNDGDMDLFVGNGYGYFIGYIMGQDEQSGLGYGYGDITFFENMGTATEALFIATANPLGDMDAYASVPAFADIDGDGDLDAFIGTAYQSDDTSYGILGPILSWTGGIEYFENVGSPYAPLFTSYNPDNPFNGMTTDKYSAPAFADIDGDGDLDALVGSKYGNLEFFENTGVVDDPVMAHRYNTDNPAWGADVGKYSKPTFVDIDGDGDMDAFVGEAFESAGIATAIEPIDVGPFDLPIRAKYGEINFFENIGTAQNPDFVQRAGVDNPLNGALGLFEKYSAVAFVDIDGDGDMDAFISAKYGYGPITTGLEEQPMPVAIQYFKNIGTATAPDLVPLPLENPAADIPPVGDGDGVSPAFVDIDNDGDFDLFIGNQDGDIYYFENIGTASAAVFDTAFPEAEMNPFGLINMGNSTGLSFADADGDGDMDIIGGASSGDLYYFENTGTASAPAFTVQEGTDNPFDAYNESNYTYAAAPAFADIDGDGDMDLFVGEVFGRIGFLENREIVPVVPPADDDDDDDDTVLIPPDDDSTCFIDSVMGADSHRQEGLFARIYASVCSMLRL